jgi:hypothetical protein
MERETPFFERWRKMVWIGAMVVFAFDLVGEIVGGEMASAGSSSLAFE